LANCKADLNCPNVLAPQISVLEIGAGA